MDKILSEVEQVFNKDIINNGEQDYISSLFLVLSENNLTIEKFLLLLKQHKCCNRHSQRREVLSTDDFTLTSNECSNNRNTCFCSPCGEVISECVTCKCNCRHTYRHILRFLS